MRVPSVSIMAVWFNGKTLGFGPKNGSSIPSTSIVYPSVAKLEMPQAFNLDTCESESHPMDHFFRDCSTTGTAPSSCLGD